jgi:hypothetical protein
MNHQLQQIKQSQKASNLIPQKLLLVHSVEGVDAAAEDVDVVSGDLEGPVVMVT